MAYAGRRLNTVIVSLAVNGAPAAIGAGVRNFRKWFPRAKVVVKDGPDDGGLLPDEVKAPL